MKTILVLEDDLTRVEWLREHIPEDTYVRHVTSVSDFIAALASTPDVALIILDHDLGYGEPTGQAAADAIPEGTVAPVIVWSMNPIGSASMYRTLMDRQVTCAMFPFLSPQLYTLIPLLLEPSVTHAL